MTWKKFSEEKPEERELIITRTYCSDGSKEHDLGLVEEGIFGGFYEKIHIEGMTEDTEWQEVEK